MNAQQTATSGGAATVAAGIRAREFELLHRERAARHLRGIVARQNAHAIEQLCDELTALHIKRIELEAAQAGRATGVQ